LDVFKASHWRRFNRRFGQHNDPYDLNVGLDQEGRWQARDIVPCHTTRVIRRLTSRSLVAMAAGRAFVDCVCKN